MYLAPGDYHCFHSPANWSIETRKHYPGKMLSVKPSVATWMPKLFAQNERVAYIGKWKNDWFFSFIAVGATNVGSITVDKDPKLYTNCYGNLPNKCLKKDMQSLQTGKGDKFGKFNLGSTVVLIFEESAHFQFDVKPGQTIRMGMKL